MKGLAKKKMKGPKKGRTKSVRKSGVARKLPRFTRVEENRMIQKLLREREIAMKQIALWQAEYSSNLRDSSGDLSSAPSHIADMGTDQMERENTFLLASGLRKKLRLIDEVLESIYKKRDFGMCRNCGRPIQKTRLRAIPYALLCLDCKKKQET